MMKKMTTLCILIATIMGIVTFSAKQKVMVLEEHLAKLNQQILTYKESRHILAAEWSYLNEPARLQRLVERHLPINAGRGGNQLVSLEAVLGPTHTPYDGDAMVRLASALEGARGEKTVR
jgi:hypothetical protein